ncbi:serine carboxypeptidase-like 7 isoform X2 [Oryza sativa Japonica Group]|uniref:serine carboxypeptidase-like 7 isoform X2 n=1 Tax=Oryza sativa subsp. japonica TaxID=39947 RepID=UPI0029189EA5|nr:hypothetical protein DAI22_11g117800 [Oryza sativa Japonica Group]
MAVRLCCCCFLLFVTIAAAGGSLTRTNVATLPGFDGALPSRLETGYVTVDEENGAELFYYFIESEGDPSTDPVLLWITGGDRCSVLSALFFEIGPLKLVIEPYNGSLPRLHYHPYSWTKVASILFVDSPVGAGFSFSRDPKGYDVGDVSASMQLIKLLREWFTEYPHYLSNPFYVGGDSYAGKIVPFIVQKISEDIEAGVRPTFNLKGYLVGNPSTGERIDLESRVPYSHGVGIISDQLYEMIMEHCEGEDYDNPSNVICQQALARFDSVRRQLLHEGSRAQILNPNCIYVSPKPNHETIDRKILKGEHGGLKHPPPQPSIKCGVYANYLSYFWANNNFTRRTLGIKKGTINEWVRCHEHDLPYNIDIRSSIKYHRNVTLKGYRALVYCGDHDAVVPFLGTQAWVRSLNYPIVDDWRAWHIDGQSAGFTIAYGNNLTFATVKGAGHTAPEFEPERCFAMFKRWISSIPL